VGDVGICESLFVDEVVVFWYRWLGGYFPVLDGVQEFLVLAVGVVVVRQWKWCDLVVAVVGLVVRGEEWCDVMVVGDVG